jgi:hypothetical protein
VSKAAALAALLRRNRGAEPPPEPKPVYADDDRIPSDVRKISQARWQRIVERGTDAEVLDETPSGSRAAEIVAELVWAVQVINRTTGMAGHKKLKGFWPESFGTGGAIYADEKRGRKIKTVYGVDEVREAEVILDWPMQFVENEEQRRALMLWVGAKASGSKPSRMKERLGIPMETWRWRRDRAAELIAMALERL